MVEPSPANGVLQLSSHNPVSQTLDRLENLLRERSVKVFPRN